MSSLARRSSTNPALRSPQPTILTMRRRRSSRRSKPKLEGPERMSILVNKDTKVLVQGLTGKTGTFHTEQALAYYCTKMIGGIHPKEGGESWSSGVVGTSRPIFASVADAIEHTGADASVIYE